MTPPAATQVKRANDTVDSIPEEKEAKKMKNGGEFLEESKTKDLANAFYKDLLPYADNKNVTEDFINRVASKLVKFLEDSNDRNCKVIEFLPPDELQQKIDFSLPEKSESINDLLCHIDKVLKYAVKTGHPRYYNQLWAGVDISSLMGQWVTSTTNTNMFTYEIAPVYLMMEQSILEKMRGYVGFTEGDGLLYPGGSISNIQAMALARYKHCPDIKNKGVFGYKKLITFTSEECHYSIGKAAGLLGLGMDNVVKINTDARGKMIVADLEAKIKESIEKGDQPFFVNATAGTTVGGAYDPFNEIADICEKYKIWMHVDGAWGGSVIVTPKYKHLMDGVHRADSVTWNPHKLLNTLLQCSVLLTKEKGLLEASNNAGATYLFQKDKKLYDVKWDTGDKTFQCGRHNDVLKLWLMWKAKGTNGIVETINTAFENARHLADQCKKRDNYVLLREPECTNVCFRYIPPKIAAMPDGPEKLDRLYKVPPEIKKHLTLEGTIMVGYQPLKKEGNFFRMITASPATNTADMDFILDEIERLGKDME